VTETVTTYAEALALLAIALGIGWLTAERFGIGWGLLALGSVILCMSALVSYLRPRKGGVE
jgi:uncharacterized membrane protein YhfC